MIWSRVLKSAQSLAVHSLLFAFTLLLVLKLDHVISCSWWIIFSPLWMFHAIVARGRFSLPAPSVPHNRHWAPCHAVAAIPLLLAFELLLCVHLESFDVHGFAAVSLKIAFLPLLILEIIILIDNFRRCRSLMPRDEENMNDEAIWETLPHFWLAVSMVFFITASLFTLLKLSGNFWKLSCDVGSLGWWDLFMNFGVAEFFAFLVCTKWSNPVIHRNSCSREASSSSTVTRYLNWNGSSIVSSEENQCRERNCGLQDIGGHFMKVAVIGFQILLCMRLEETPANAKYIPLPVVFSPLFLLQGAAVIFAASRLVERLIIMLRSGAVEGIYFRFSARAHECMGFLYHGSKFLGWWSIDEESREEQARLFNEGATGYSTFSDYPPEIVKTMPKKDLAEEIRRLQEALGKQTEVTNYSQQEFERLQTEKLLCRICFEVEISVVLLPCRHRILCRTCSDKCKKCPVCRVSIKESLPVYDV
ncbi:Transmembrane Fragile-X-F-associated protein [Senna tora]|uniref:Transmembrane Fragile-X-F-associated protein n=1 Tax=Senna tora TaxID=362788 RepID=A0A834SP42_9FABA|nr:Transmembrane Fragile-X-F-associated protein [Senna tora]